MRTINVTCPLWPHSREAYPRSAATVLDSADRSRRGAPKRTGAESKGRSWAGYDPRDRNLRGAPEEGDAVAERIFVGVAWPYANYVLHVGQAAGAYLPADIFARYQRMRGNDVLMVSGSDSHGTPITVRAEAEGRG